MAGLLLRVAIFLAVFGRLTASPIGEIHEEQYVEEMGFADLVNPNPLLVDPIPETLSAPQPQAFDGLLDWFSSSVSRVKESLKQVADAANTVLQRDESSDRLPRVAFLLTGPSAEPLLSSKLHWSLRLNLLDALGVEPTTFLAHGYGWSEAQRNGAHDRYSAVHPKENFEEGSSLRGGDITEGMNWLEALNAAEGPLSELLYVADTKEWTRESVAADLERRLLTTASLAESCHGLKPSLRQLSAELTSESGDSLKDAIHSLVTAAVAVQDDFIFDLHARAVVYERLKAYEADRGFTFDWVVVGTISDFITTPMPIVSSFTADRIWLPHAGALQAASRPLSWALLPRNLAESFLGTAHEGILSLPPGSSSSTWKVSSSSLLHDAREAVAASAIHAAFSSHGILDPEIAKSDAAILIGNDAKMRFSASADKNFIFSSDEKAGTGSSPGGAGGSPFCFGGSRLTALGVSSEHWCEPSKLSEIHSEQLKSSKSLSDAVRLYCCADAALNNQAGDVNVFFVRLLSAQRVPIGNFLLSAFAMKADSAGLVAFSSMSAEGLLPPPPMNFETMCLPHSSARLSTDVWTVYYPFWAPLTTADARLQLAPIGAIGQCLFFTAGNSPWQPPSIYSLGNHIHNTMEVDNLLTADLTSNLYFQWETLPKSIPMNPFAYSVVSILPGLSAENVLEVIPEPSDESRPFAFVLPSRRSRVEFTYANKHLPTPEGLAAGVGTNDQMNRHYGEPLRRQFVMAANPYSGAFFRHDSLSRLIETIYELLPRPTTTRIYSLPVDPRKSHLLKCMTITSNKIKYRAPLKLMPCDDSPGISALQTFYTPQLRWHEVLPTVFIDKVQAQTSPMENGKPACMMVDSLVDYGNFMQNVSTNSFYVHECVRAHDQQHFRFRLVA